MTGSTATMRSKGNRQHGMRRAAWIAAAALALGLVAIVTTPPAAQAQEHSNRPIRIIVGAGAGGGLDVQVRIIGQMLPKVLGQDIVIENWPGGGGVIAGQVVASAPPDGNTLFAYGGDLFSVAALMPHTSFDANKQLVPISQISETPLLVVTGGHSTFSM